VERRTAGEVVRLAVHVVIDELVVDGLQLEFDTTFNGSVDEQVEDAQSQVSVVTRAHESRRH